MPSINFNPYGVSPDEPPVIGKPGAPDDPPQSPNSVVILSGVTGEIGDALVISGPEQRSTDAVQEPETSDNYEPKLLNQNDIDKVVSSIIAGSLGPNDELYKDLMYTVSENQYTKQINKAIKKYSEAIEESQYDNDTTDGMRESWSANLERLNTQISEIRANEQIRQQNELDRQLIKDIAENGLGEQLVDEDGNISYSSASWLSLQGGITSNEMNIKDIRDKINAEQKHWAEGSPQWNNLELAKESLEPAEIKRTKQQLEVGYNQDVKQQKTNKRNNDVAKVDINSYVEQLQNATPEERQEIFDQLAEMVNNGSIPVEAVGTLMTDFVTQYRGNGGKGVILKKYGDIESDVKEFVGKINPKKRDKLIDAYLDADPNNMVSCGQIFGREASDAILKRRQAALSNNQKYLGKYRGENTPKPDDGCATISDRITKNECARGSQNQNK